MPPRAQIGDWFKLLIILLLLWPPLVLFFFLPNHDGAAPPVLWMIGAAAALLGWMLLGRPEGWQRRTPQYATPPIDTPPVITEAMEVEDTIALSGGVRVYKGHLKAPADIVLDRLRTNLAARSYHCFRSAKTAPR